MLFIPDEHRDEWDLFNFEGPRHPCFLCGHPVGEGQVILWSGSTGSADPDQPASDDPDVEAVVRELRRRGPVSAGMCVFFHPKCVPSFCRRILEDWERSAGMSPARDRQK